MLHALRQAIESARAQGKLAEADRVQDLMDEAVEKIIGWQARSIDEITRQTREYELDYRQILGYRQAIADALVRLMIGETKTVQ